MKVKELRLLILHSILLLMVITAIVYFAVQQDMMRVAVASFIGLLFAKTTLTRGNIHVFDDCMIVYKVNYFMNLPKTIQFDEIKEVQQFTKRKVLIMTDQKNVIVVKDAKKFIEELETIISNYKSK